MRTLWTDTAPHHAFPPLDRRVQVDVAVVGAGIAGLTAAILLQRAGRSVAVVEAGEVAGGESCHTSAHLTAVQDTRFFEIDRTFGKEAAELVAQHGMAAIDLVEHLSGEYGIDCDFARVPGWLFTERSRDRKQLEKEAQAAREAGLQAHLVDEVPLPFPTAGAVRFDGQAVFHPLLYLRGLADAFARRGGMIFEGSRVLSVDDGKPCKVSTAQGSVVARDVIVATDSPISNRIFLHTKLSPYRTYIVAGRIDEPLPGLFWDTADPYHYVRTWQNHDGGVEVIVGGEDHRVGELEDTDSAYDRLEGWAASRLGLKVDRCWSGQVNEPADGLPYVGRNALSLHVYVATGFSGTGLANGTMAGMILADELEGRTHPLSRLFAATRVKPLASAKEVLVHNADNARHYVQDWLSRGDAAPLEEIGPGEGRLVQLGGEKLAVFRDDGGALHAVSPICTHLGCQVHWNAGDKSWDCPCHGSRYSPTGEVLHGPAVKALARREIPGEAVSPAPGAASERPAEEGEHPA